MEIVRKYLPRILYIPMLLCFSFTGCVGDIDLEEAEEIKLRPTAVIELVDFNFEADLLPQEAYIEPVPFTQTVSFEVLTDDLQESVVAVELIFGYTNSLPRVFNAELVFLSDKGKQLHMISFEIPSGSIDSPVKNNITEYIQGEELDRFKSAVNLKVELEMLPGPSAESGGLHLGSTASYQFEF